jgi:hypothetical protein
MRLCSASLFIISEADARFPYKVLQKREFTDVFDLSRARLIDDTRRTLNAARTPFMLLVWKNYNTAVFAKKRIRSLCRHPVNVNLLDYPSKVNRVAETVRRKRLRNLIADLRSATLYAYLCHRRS